MPPSAQRIWVYKSGVQHTAQPAHCGAESEGGRDQSDSNAAEASGGLLTVLRVTGARPLLARMGAQASRHVLRVTSCASATRPPPPRGPAARGSARADFASRIMHHIGAGGIGVASRAVMGARARRRAVERRAGAAALWKVEGRRYISTIDVQYDGQVKGKKHP